MHSHHELRACLSITLSTLLPLLKNLIVKVALVVWRQQTEKENDRENDKENGKAIRLLRDRIGCLDASHKLKQRKVIQSAKPSSKVNNVEKWRKRRL